MSLKDKNYRVVTDPAETDGNLETPVELEGEMEELYVKSNKGKASIKGRLDKLIKRYPKLPFLRNYLVKWYEVNGQDDAANRVNEELLKLFPDYLFAIAYKVGALVGNNDIEAVEKLLAGRLDIESFFPGRRSFHLSEFRTAVSLAVEYLCARGRFDEADERIVLLEEAEINDSVTEPMRLKVMRCRYLKVREQRAADEEMEVHAIQRMDCTLPQKEVLMKPLSPRFEWLYAVQWDMDATQLADCIEHDKGGLYTELQYIITTAIEGYEYSEKHAYETDEWSAAVLHALLILPYIDDETTIHAALELFRQPHACVELWVMDWKEDVLSKYFHKFSETKLQCIVDFILESPGNTSAKLTILEMLPQFVLHTPDSRDKLVHGLDIIFKHFIAHRDDETLFDSEVLAWAVGAAVDLKAAELMDVIASMYEKGWVSLRLQGGIDDVKELMVSEKNTIRGVFFDDVVAHLKNIVDEERKGMDGMIESMMERAARGFPVIEDDDDDDVYKTPHVKPNIYANVSRNAPCPCGSGKKYKRCHGK